MSRPLSILIVLHDFTLGGTERIAVRLAGAWVAAGAVVTLFCGSDAGPLRALLDPRVRLVVADPPFPRARGSRRALARAVRRSPALAGCDVAFVPGNFHWPVAGALAARGLPVVVQVSAALDKPQRGPLRQALFDLRMRRLLHRVAAVVALSDRARDQADRILHRAVTRTIALPAIADDAPPPRPAIAAPHLLAAGRLVPEKGFDTLIAALARIQAPATLTIVGEGPDRARLEALVRTLGLGARVRLPGYLPDIRPALDAARLFVLGSRFEGYPAVLVEALAAGRPVVATDCTPATALLAAPGAGAVVPIADAAAMANAIDQLLAAPPPDPHRLAAMVAQHRIGPVARAYLDLFAMVAQ
jgi:glycosyltransferase involved in cell wall biosynthesis